MKPAGATWREERDRLPSTAHAIYGLAILMVVTFTALLDRYLIGLLLEPIKAEFAISDTQASLLQGLAFAFFYSFFGLPFGRLVDKGNRRNIIFAGIVLWSVMTVCCGLATNYTFLFISRLGVGFGEACLAPAAYSLITDMFAPSRHGRALAFFTLSSILGGGGSFIIGAEAMSLAAELSGQFDLTAGMATWRLTFILVGAPGLLVALLLLTVREPARQRTGHQRKLPALSELKVFIGTIRKPLFTLVAANAIVSIAGTGVVGWLAIFLFRTYAVPVTTGGTWIGVALILSALAGGPIAGLVADSSLVRRSIGGKINVALAGCLLCVPLAVAFPLMPSPSAAMALFFVYALFYNLQACAAPAVLQDILPNRFKGQVGALYWLIVGLVGLGGGSTIVALITDRVFGDEQALRLAIAIVAGVCLSCSALILALGRRSYQAVLDRQAADLAG